MDRPALSCYPLMSVIDEILLANHKYSQTHDPKRVSSQPRRKLAVLTCMDSRLDRLCLGLERDNAHIIRNAGGIATDDAIRSLLASIYRAGSQEIMVVNHSDCGMNKITEQGMHDLLVHRSDLPPSPPLHFHTFADVEENLRRQLRRLRAHSAIPKAVAVRGFVYDVETGKLNEVKL